MQFRGKQSEVCAVTLLNAPSDQSILLRIVFQGKFRCSEDLQIRVITSRFYMTVKN